LRSYDLAPSPPSHPPSAISKLDRRHSGKLRKKDNLPKGEWEEKVGRGSESCDRKKDWSSINHSILAGGTLFFSMCTLTKQEKKFLIDKEIQKGAVAKSYMTNGLLIYD
jgi:hypothetical protein